MGKKKPSTGKATKKLPEFDKYKYYEKSVQNFQNEVEFLRDNFQKLRKRKAYTLREDFCGTGGISCNWVAQGDKYQAWGVDLDPEPVEYGKEHHFSKIPEKFQKNMHYIMGNVLTAKTPQVDICFAFNFSYQVFKKRADLLAYFKAVKQHLVPGGVFFLDLFGGPESQTLVTDIIAHDGFDYFWECQKFNPITNECRFAIHFKRDGEKKRKNVFVYEWRQWSLAELRDVLIDAGFKSTVAYWEGEDGEGGGDGEFYASEDEDNCDAWVTYIAALT